MPNITRRSLVAGTAASLIGTRGWRAPMTASGSPSWGSEDEAAIT